MWSLLKPTTAGEVRDLIDGATLAAVLGAAMEMELFWLLDESPLDSDGVARALGLSPRRAGYLLQVLRAVDLVEESEEGWRPTGAARRAILEGHSRETWSQLAAEARERLPALVDLARGLRAAGSVWETLGREPPDYLAQLAEDPERAGRFTRMLFELHRDLAEELAELVDLGERERVMDLGGGSGVVSLALLRRHPGATAVVVDLANVCVVARELAAAGRVGDRITFVPADFLRDELPSGFDLVLECDVGVFEEELFRKVRRSLRREGRFLIVDQFAPAPGIAHPARLHWALQGSLKDPEFGFATAVEVEDRLRAAGFARVSRRALPAAAASSRFARGLTLIEARS